MSEESKTYKAAGAFRTALEARLQNRARAAGTDLQRPYYARFSNAPESAS